jgi:hypothetical protein
MVVEPPTQRARQPERFLHKHRQHFQQKERLMAKYGRKAEQKVEKAMHERKRGTLKSGGSGKTVRSRKQAIAIGLSEARREGGKVPAKRGAKKKSRKSGSKSTGRSRKSTTRARKTSSRPRKTAKTARRSRKR